MPILPRLTLHIRKVKILLGCEWYFLILTFPQKNITSSRGMTLLTILLLYYTLNSVTSISESIFSFYLIDYVHWQIWIPATLRDTWIIWSALMKIYRSLFEVYIRYYSIQLNSPRFIIWEPPSSSLYRLAEIIINSNNFNSEWSIRS